MVHLELVIAKTVVVLLGLSISVQAYRGYRRHDSWPMLYLSIGFLVISIGSVIEGLLVDVAHMDLITAGSIQSVIVAGGMVIILYSLYANAPIRGGAEDR